MEVGHPLIAYLETHRELMSLTAQPLSKTPASGAYTCAPNGQVSNNLNAFKCVPSMSVRVFFVPCSSLAMETLPLDCAGE